MVNKFDSFEPVNGQPPPSEVGKLSDCLTQTQGTKTETRLVRQTGDTRHGQAEVRNLSRQMKQEAGMTSDN